MAEAVLERRREPRVSIGPGTRVGAPVALSVRVLDISANGVLISSPQRMNVGQRARLQLTLAGEPVNVEVEVKRVAVTGTEGFSGSHFRLGATFVSPDEPSRRSVHQFLRTDGA